MTSETRSDLPERDAREWWIPLVSVAAMLVIGALLAAFLLGERGAEQGRSPAPLRSRIGFAARAALVAMGSSEEEFEAARTELLDALETRSGNLPDASRSAIADSLRIIEGQIAAISDELAHDPENTRLARLLAEAYRRELELLQTAAGLSTIGGETGSS
jgi:hypothetical protein